MPGRKQRDVILNQECKQVLEILQSVVTDQGFSVESVEEDRRVLSALQVSVQLPAGHSLLSEVIRFAEKKTKVVLGGQKQELPECAAEMDSGSEALFIAYQQYWIALLRQEENCSAKEIEAKDINRSSILIMELYLRLTMQALRSDSPLRPNQKRQIFIKILENFTNTLSKKNLLTGSLQQALFDQHKSWVNEMVMLADYLDQMNMRKPVLKENLEYLNLLMDDIKRYLVLCLVGKDAHRGKWEDKLSANQLTYTLKECEDNCLAKNDAVKRFKIESEPSLAILTEYMSIEEAKIEVLVEMMGKDQICRQTKLIQLYGKDSNVNQLYKLWNEVKLLHAFVNLIKDLSETTGWLPFLIGMVNLSLVDGRISDVDATCKKIFSSLKPKNFNTLFGKEFGISANSRQVKGSLTGLSLLQEHELLKTVCVSLVANVTTLEKLGKLLYCPVQFNPFNQWNNNDVSEIDKKLASISQSSSSIMPSIMPSVEIKKEQQKTAKNIVEAKRSPFTTPSSKRKLSRSYTVYPPEILLIPAESLLV